MYEHERRVVGDGDVLSCRAAPSHRRSPFAWLDKSNGEVIVFLWRRGAFLM